MDCLCSWLNLSVFLGVNGSRTLCLCIGLYAYLERSRVVSKRINVYFLYIFDPLNDPPMAFRLKNDKIKSTVIRLEVYIPGETSRFKYNTGRSIKPEHLDQKNIDPKQ